MFGCRRIVSGAASLLQRVALSGSTRLQSSGEPICAARHYHETCCRRVYRRLPAGRAVVFTGDRDAPFGSSLVSRACTAAFVVKENIRVHKLTELESTLTVRFARAMQTRSSSTSSSSSPATDKHELQASGAEGQGSDGKPSKAQQLRKVFKEYGAVGVSFHIGISLISLGIFYLAVSSGLDMASLLCKLGFSEAVVQSKMAAGTSTFVLAYAVHKLFAPVRISITLVCVPLIVRHLRKTGLFKPRTSGP